MITIDALLEWRKKNLWDALDKLAREKGEDYSGRHPDRDTFANLRLVEHTMGIPVEIGIQVRLHDKFMRMNELMMRDWKTGEGPTVKDESLTVTINDYINYLSYIQALRAERLNGGALPKVI